MNPKTSFRVAIADDCEMFATALRVWINRFPHFNIVGTFTNGRHLLDAFDDMRPDMILMDLAIPGVSGIQVTRQIKSRAPGTKVVAMSMLSDGKNVMDAMDSGASAYMVKNITQKNFDSALNSVINDEVYIAPAAAINYATYSAQRKVYHHTCDDGHINAETFSRREVEVIRYINEGYGNKEIAGRMHISVRTVDAHKRNIMRKMGVQRSIEVLRVAQKLNLI